MVNAGRILIIAKGEWDNLTNYEQLDLVSYDNIAYLARKASVGVNPANDTQLEYWQPFGVVSDVATTEKPGLVMPDGTTITITANGLIKATPGMENIKDISIVGLLNKQIIRYNTSTSKWENTTLGAAADKGVTSSAIIGSSDLIESGAVALIVQSITESTYNVNDDPLTQMASNDLVPIYDVSEGEKKKVTIGNIIKLTVSNPNLLDNPWFTVNQRGQNSYPSGSARYTLDRWYASTSESVEVNTDSSVTISNTSTSNSGLFQQYLENSLRDNLLGKTVTISTIVDGVLYKDTFAMPSTVQTAYEVGAITIDDMVLRLRFNASSVLCFYFDHGANSSNSYTIKAVKLEIGSVSTLAMDTAPNYATELLKCQRYFYRMEQRGANNYWKTVMANYPDILDVDMELPVPMRNALTISGSLQASKFTATNYAAGTLLNTPTAIPSARGHSQALNNLTIRFSGITVTVGQMYAIFLGLHDYIDISADL